MWWWIGGGILAFVLFVWWAIKRRLEEASIDGIVDIFEALFEALIYLPADMWSGACNTASSVGDSFSSMDFGGSGGDCGGGGCDGGGGGGD